MKSRSMSNGIGDAGMRLLYKTLTTRRNLYRVTVIFVVSAAELASTPAILFPVKLAHYPKYPEGSERSI